MDFASFVGPYHCPKGRMTYFLGQNLNARVTCILGRREYVATTPVKGFMQSFYHIMGMKKFWTNCKAAFALKSNYTLTPVF